MQLNNATDVKNTETFSHLHMANVFHFSNRQRSHFFFANWNRISFKFHSSSGDRSCKPERRLLTVFAYHQDSGTLATRVKTEKCQRFLFHLFRPRSVEIFCKRTAYISDWESPIERRFVMISCLIALRTLAGRYRLTLHDDEVYNSWSLKYTFQFRSCILSKCVR